MQAVVCSEQLSLYTAVNADTLRVHPGLLSQSTLLRSLDLPADLGLESQADSQKHIQTVKNLGTQKTPFSLFDNKSKHVS